jgi:hypothetical protein
MVKFQNITDDAYLDKSKFKRWTYTPTRNAGNVYAPYEGVVFGVNQNKGLIKIKHNFGNDYYISKIYDLGSINKSNGDKVIAGELIGKTSDKPFNFEIVDSGNLEQLISPFFTGSVNIKQDVQNKKELQPTKEVGSDKKENKYKEQNKNKEEKKVKRPSSAKSYDPGPLSLLDLGLVPFHLIGAGVNYLKNRLKKKEEEKYDNLYEEVKRIKELLK